VEDHIDKKEARKLDQFSQYAIVSATEAMADAALMESNPNLDRIGVIWGSGVGGLKTFQEESKNFFAGDGTPRFNPFFIPKMIADIAAGHISIKFGLRGPNYVTVSACASATNAIIDSFNLIRLGKADAIVTGGSEAAVNEMGMGGFNALKALSTRNDSPQTASRPFDMDRDGFVLGEGAGALILEEYEHAIKRGAKIYAEVIGGGMSGDAYHMTAPHPDGIGARNTMIAAIEDAEISASDIDYVNVHGTSTPLGDIAEVKAIQAVFGEHAYNLNISSTKSMTGHLLGAAGAIEAIACVMSVVHDIIPPTINHFTDDPELDSKLNFTFNEAQKRTVNIALSNTFGFGGHNTSVIVKKFKS
jgi:3-oxoacyl-[acyl-carrier-protein] synthase II